MEYTALTLTINQHDYSFLIKAINDTKYFIIPVDHYDADLIESYNRQKVEFNYQETKDWFTNKLQTTLTMTINHQEKQIETSNQQVTYKLNDPATIDKLIDFITLGDQTTRDIKKSFLKEYIHELQH